MQNTPRLMAALALAGALFTAPTAGQAPRFELRAREHIGIIGNTLAERMQYDGWLETLLHARFPKHELVVRNLGFSGDEIATRLRSRNFGTPDEWLQGRAAPVGGYQDNRLDGADTKVDVIFAFFGYNESFAGPDGLPAFRKQLDDWITHTLAQKYNGRSAPRLVLFSPIAHENLGNPDLPDGTENNRRLELYTRAMAEIAAARGVKFVDLFAATSQLYASTAAPLTIQGVHLNGEGNRRVAEVIDRALFGDAPAQDQARLERLRQAVVEKDFYWFNRYRTTDGFATYGDRAFLTFIRGNPRNVDADVAQAAGKDAVLPTNYEVLQRELAMLDVMTRNRDRRIWAVAAGADLKINDGNAPPPIDARTNEPGRGPGGAHVFLEGHEAIGKMTAGKGMKVELFASEKEFPELVNPVQMAFDTRGRLWVAAWKNYPHWEPRTPMDDKLLILEDTNGDGKADKRTVFAGDLNNPTGFEFYNGGVILAQAPNLVFLKDTNGDDRYDTKEILLHGFDTADTHHTINSFTFDPGGALYMGEGIFHRSQIETPWAPTTRLSDGGVFRFEPRTWKLDVYVPHNFPNPHGHVFDSWGRNILFDATGGQPFYGPSFSTKKYYPAQETSRAPRPGAVRTRPVAGAEILSSRHFPDDMQGNVIVLNVIGFRGLLNYKLSEDGAGLKWVETEPILQSSDENFRPVDAEVGADGALYVADWHNPIIGHMQHNLRDKSRDRLHGRIYRVTYPGRPLLQPARIAGEPIPRLLDLLKEPEDRVRYRAKIELSGRQTAQVLDALQRWAAGLDPRDSRYEHHMLEALWVQQWHNRVDETLLKRMLRSSDPWARAAATRVLCYARDRIADPLALLKVQANDAHPAVRLEAVRAASFFQSPDAAVVALESLKHPQDRFLTYTLDQAMRTLDRFVTPILFETSPRAVEYQLARLSNEQLLRVERPAGDAKYRPVHLAVLTRKAMSRTDRAAALAALVQLDGSSPTHVLLEALAAVPGSEATESDTQNVDILLGMLLTQPPELLRQQRDALARAAADARAPLVRRAAYGGMMIADGDPGPAWQAASAREGHLAELLRAVPHLGGVESLRASLPAPVTALMAETRDPATRAAAIGAMAAIRRDGATFDLLAREVQQSADAESRKAAIKFLQLIPESAWPSASIEPVARAIVAMVRQAPVPQRTTPAMLDAIQLCERLTSALPAEARVAVRRDLRAVGVQIVRIQSVPEQMMFDLNWFVVQRGQPLQIVFSNPDAMPHNLVIGQPGSVQEIGTKGGLMSPPADPEAKAYVPDTPLVLQATRLLNAGESGRVNFTAPARSGQYIYVCTFPGHWVRMYGVMLVVDDLDAWERQPTVPTDPMTNKPFAAQRNGAGS
ncbi:MAG TPA: PVC-type heme-binding CxxCH protein [Vicinamibacterales bacterium]|nr:PVC-type heme-binding CxxCH protein [Vicinamibacterales bacterium]